MGMFYCSYFLFFAVYTYCYYFSSLNKFINVSFLKIILITFFNLKILMFSIHVLKECFFFISDLVFCLVDFYARVVLSKAYKFDLVVWPTAIWIHINPDHKWQQLSLVWCNGISKSSGQLPGIAANSTFPDLWRNIQFCPWKVQKWHL